MSDDRGSRLVARAKANVDAPNQHLSRPSPRCKPVPEPLAAGAPDPCPRTAWRYQALPPNPSNAYPAVPSPLVGLPMAVGFFFACRHFCAFPGATHSRHQFLVAASFAFSVGVLPFSPGFAASQSIFATHHHVYNSCSFFFLAMHV